MGCWRELQHPGEPGLVAAEQGGDQVKAELLKKMEADQRDNGPTEKPKDPCYKPEEPVADNEFETGIIDDSEVPASSQEMTGVNRWSNVVDGTRWIVYAGNAGWDEPNTGQVLVIPMEGRAFGQGKTSQTKGTGSLKIVDVDGALVHLRDERGDTHTYDLTTSELK